MFVCYVVLTFFFFPFVFSWFLCVVFNCGFVVGGVCGVGVGLRLAGGVIHVVHVIYVIHVIHMIYVIHVIHVNYGFGLCVACGVWSGRGTDWMVGVMFGWFGVGRLGGVDVYDGVFSPVSTG